MKKGPGPRGSRDEEFLVPSLDLLLLLEIGKFHNYSAVQNNQIATSYCSAEMLCHINITVKAALTENGYFATLLDFIRIYQYIFGSVGLFLGHL